MKWFGFLPLPNRMFLVFFYLKGSMEFFCEYMFLKNLCMELWRFPNCPVPFRPCPANWVCLRLSPPSGYRSSGAVPCRYPPTPSLHWHCSCLHQVTLLYLHQLKLFLFESKGYPRLRWHFCASDAAPSSSSSVRLRSGGSGSCRRRRLLRPGSEPLQVNIVSHIHARNTHTHNYN